MKKNAGRCLFLLGELWCKAIWGYEDWGVAMSYPASISFRDTGSACVHIVSCISSLSSLPLPLSPPSPSPPLLTLAHSIARSIPHTISLHLKEKGGRFTISLCQITKLDCVLNLAIGILSSFFLKKGFFLFLTLLQNVPSLLSTLLQ